MKLHPKIEALYVDLAKAHAECRTLAAEAKAKAQQETDPEKALRLWREEAYQRGVSDAAQRVHTRLFDIKHPPKKK